MELGGKYLEDTKKMDNDQISKNSDGTVGPMNVLIDLRKDEISNLREILSFVTHNALDRISKLEEEIKEAEILNRQFHHLGASLTWQSVFTIEKEERESKDEQTNTDTN